MIQVKGKVTSGYTWSVSALFLSSLLLAGCGSGTATPVSDSSVSSSSAPVSSQPVEDNSAQESSDSGADATSSQDSSASPIALDDSQVTEAENLVQEVQSALRAAELAPASTEETEDGDSQATANLDLSTATQDKILKVATGSAADDFMATAYEYSRNGWTVDGSPTFVGEPKVSFTTVDGAEAKKLEVCVDSSQVKVKDQAGNSLLGTDAPTRSLTFYTLVSIDNTWKIASIDFPDNPDC